MTAFEGKVALIIEDDESSIQVLEHLLRQMRVRAITIRDSGPVEQMFEQLERPDVIFLDLEMPHLNGYNVLELIQSNAKFEGVPTVAYTTHTSHINRAKRVGFHSFLGKPLDSARFGDQLRTILSHEPVWEVPN
jgi:CheY-like chemotaxis protein